MPKLRLPLLVLLLQLAAAAAHAQPARIDRLVERFIADERVVGMAVAVMKKSADLERAVPTTVTNARISHRSVTTEIALRDDGL